MDGRPLSLEEQIRHDVIVARRGGRRPLPRPVKLSTYVPRHARPVERQGRPR